MFTNLNNLAFFCGVGAFYAQQTDQHNLFLGLVAATVGLIVLNFREESSFRSRNEREDLLYRRIDDVERRIDNDLTNLNSRIIDK